MAIDFPAAPVDGTTYDYLGIRYTFVKPDANVGYWNVSTHGSVGNASWEEINAGTDDTKYITPFGIEGSDYVDEGQLEVVNTRINAHEIDAKDAHVGAAIGYNPAVNPQTAAANVQDAMDDMGQAILTGSDYLPLHGKADDSDLLDGFNSAVAETGNTVAVRDVSGDIQARLFRSSYPEEAAIASASDMCFRNNGTTDAFMRFGTLTAVKNWLGIGTMKAFVTNTGSNGNGYYRLWSDGYQECWIDISTSASGTWTYPVAFSTLGSVNIQLTSRDTTYNSEFSTVIKTGYVTTSNMRWNIGAVYTNGHHIKASGY